MEIDTKLEEFSNLVLQEASQEKRKILDQIRLKVNEANKKSRQEIIDKAEMDLKIATEKEAKLKNEELSKAAIEAKKIVIEKRKELINNMYNTVISQLNEFVNSEQYPMWLIKQIDEAKTQLDDNNITVYIGKADEKINLETNAKIQIDNEITIGGCKIISEKKHMLVDNTLSKKLEEAFSQFNKLIIKQNFKES